MNKLINESKVVIKQIILNFKYLFSSGKSLLLILPFIASSWILSIFLVPIKFGIPFTFFFGAIAPASLLYISTTFAWREGTLYKNISMTKNNRYLFYISSFIFMFLITYIFVFAILISLSILNQFGFLIQSWRGSGVSGYYSFIQMINLPFLYSIFEMMLVMFALLFMFQHIFNSKTSMFSLVLILTFLDLMWGGMFNIYFTNFGQLENETGIYVPMFEANVFSSSLYLPSAILFPFFGPGQHLATMKFAVCDSPYYASFWDNSKWFVWISSNDHFLDDVLGTYSISGFKYALSWDILWFLPYAHTMIFVSVGAVLSKTTK